MAIISYKTQIIETKSGREIRNQLWVKPRRSFKLSHIIKLFYRKIKGICYGF
jgi:hypothetical protein